MLALGLVAGWYRGDVLAARSSPIAARYIDAVLVTLGCGAYTTLAVLFCRMSGPRSWLPPVMLIGAAVDLLQLIDPHPVLLSLVGLTWLLTLVLHAPRLTPLRIASVVVCGIGIIELQLVHAR